MFVSQHQYVIIFFLINLIEIGLPQQCFSKGSVYLMSSFQYIQANRQA